jgi:hypothetical protein
MKTDGEQRQILSSQRPSLSFIRIRLFTSFRVDPKDRCIGSAYRKAAASSGAVHTLQRL